MQLTPNFTLSELTITTTGLPNEPDQLEIENLRALAENVLQPLRMMFGMPITINSGFRSQIVNQAVGGSATSQHCYGMAADLDSTNNAMIFQIIRSSLQFDQLIWEGGNDTQPDWVHVSYKSAGNRGQVLRMVNGHYYPI